MPLYGATHWVLLAAIAAVSVWLGAAARKDPQRACRLRLAVGIGLAANEIVWNVYRYSHEGLRFPDNLPLQLCDLAVWLSVAACLTLRPGIVETAYFIGLAGASMALLMPDLWSPWPSYPAIYFFAAHGGVVAAAALLIFGGMHRLRPGAARRSFFWLAAYAVALGAFNAITEANFMYLCRKPSSPNILDWFGPWPYYLGGGALCAVGLFWLLEAAARRLSPSNSATPARTRLV